MLLRAALGTVSRAITPTITVWHAVQQPPPLLAAARALLLATDALPTPAYTAARARGQCNVANKSCAPPSRAFSSSRIVDQRDGGSSSSSSTGNDEGLPRSKLSALPFQLTLGEAERAYEKWHSSGWFSSLSRPQYEQVKEIFLPFYAVSAEVTVRVDAAQIGKRVFVNRYNRHTRRYEPSFETEWQWVRPGSRYQRTYESVDEGMQPYAGHKYMRADVQRMAPGPRLQAAQPMTADLATSTTGGARKIYPFTVRPATAVSWAYDWMQRAELESIRQALMTTYRADAVQDIRADIRYLHVMATPVYCPAYVFKFRHRGQKVHTFVSGLTADQVAGTKILNEGLIGLAAGGAAAAYLAWSGLVPLGVVPWYAVGMASAAAWAALFWPRLRAKFMAIAYQPQEQQRVGGGVWDEEFLHGYQAFREYERARQHQRVGTGGSGAAGGGYGQQQGGARQAGGARAAARDPRGYYRMLGVEPNASQDEIQAAFRGLAFKLHPDRVDGSPALKHEAGEKFKAVLEAYGILRDPAKRQQYDSGSL